MSADFEMKQGDTLPVFAFTCKDTNGPVDISTATAVKFHLVRGATVVINNDCFIIDDGSTPLRGKGEYRWVAPETDDLVGVYDAEIEVTMSSGNVLTFPDTKNNPKIQFNKQLA